MLIIAFLEAPFLNELKPVCIRSRREAVTIYIEIALNFVLATERY